MSRCLRPWTLVSVSKRCFMTGLPCLPLLCSGQDFAGEVPSSRLLTVKRWLWAVIRTACNRPNKNKTCPRRVTDGVC